MLMNLRHGLLQTECCHCWYAQEQESKSSYVKEKWCGPPLAQLRIEEPTTLLQQIPQAVLMFS